MANMQGLAAMKAKVEKMANDLQDVQKGRSASPMQFETVPFGVLTFCLSPRRHREGSQ